MYLFDQKATKENLNDFFSKYKTTVNSFGSTVNQTFEAYVFANCIKWFMRNGWNVQIINPRKGMYKNKFKLKFNTRGAPSHYSYALCKKNNETKQIHHGLRVSTRYEDYSEKDYSANICLDVAIIHETDVSCFETDCAIPNSQLISFGEAKHMSAFAELIAGFIGMVHELLPENLEKNNEFNSDEIYPFLYVSGKLNPTAKGILETIKKREIKIRIYSFDEPMI